MTDDARRARRLRKTELALRALAEHGNPKKAAAHLGIHESTLRKWVAEYCELRGYDSVVQAAYWLQPDDRMSA
jgi:transposase-like protein